MGQALSIGSSLRTKFGKTATVKSYIAEGGQGFVYVVDYDGHDMALKWYKQTGLGKEPDEFYDNIYQNVKRGSPSKEFLWPIDITEWQNDTFGYIMGLRPDGYYELTQYMLCKCRFSSYRAAINASLQIVSAFRKLHNDGYSYQDLNDGNFFIEPKKGSVLICDNDNVAPDQTQTGILGKPRYMAPEIVMGKSMPNSYSDRFSMAVILFLIFHLTHPLEGKRYLTPGLSPELQEKLYGTEALFTMDPDDHSNEPDPYVNRNVIAVWDCLPDYMRNIFFKSFSHKTMLEKPTLRPSEKEWLNALTRFRSEIATCGCGNEVFTQGGIPCKCDSCGKMLSIPFRLELRDYCIPALKDSRIYRCQIDVCNEENALDPVALVVQKKDQPGILGIRNMSGKIWNAITTKGVSRKVMPDEIIPLKDGITFTVFDHTISINQNL